MKKFTKLFMTLALLCVAGSVSAERVYADLSKYGDKWDATEEVLTFSWTTTTGNQLGPNLDAIGLPKGDLRNWEKLVVVVDELSNCDFFRVLVYNGDDTGHSNTLKANKTGANEFTLSGNVDFLNNVTRICLSGSNWDDSQNSSWGTTPASFKVKEVYLERPDVVYIEPSEIFEAPTGTVDVKNLEGTKTDWASTVVYPKEFVVQGQSFGDGNGDKESTHVNIEGYDYICFNVTTATNNTAGLRVWIWDGEAGGTGTVKTLYAYPIADYKTANFETSTKINGVGTYVTKVTGYKYLKGVKAANDYGSSASVVSMAYMCKGDPVAYVPTNKYALVGISLGSASLEDVLSNANAVCYDATGVTGTGINLEAANPNALFIANEGTLANTKNVIVNGTCANLELTDVYPFNAPVAFTATSAKFTKTMKADYGTMVIPFTATVPEGVEAYEITASNGEVLTTNKVEEITANKPVMLKGSSNVFTASGAAIAATTEGVQTNGLLSGVYVAKAVPTVNTYVLQKQGEDVNFYKAISGLTVNPFRAYLTTAAGAARLTFDFNEATGIKTVKTTEGTEVYNLQGVRVAYPTKGLYIVNGKKVIK